MQLPETKFARVGDDRVAYQVLGAGPPDLLYTPGFWSHLDMLWEEPAVARFFRRMATFGRLIQFDRRGCGVSDRPSADGDSPVEHWVRDFAAVLEAAGAAAPVIVCAGDSGPVVLEFVRRYPARCTGLVFINTFACWSERPDYPQGVSDELFVRGSEFLMRHWGRPEYSARYIPSQANNPAVMNWFAKYQRSITAPRNVIDSYVALQQIDSRPVLSQVRVPTLVLSRRQTMLGPGTLERSRYLADHIAGARFIELPGSDVTVIWDTSDLALDHIEQFVTGRRRGAPDRVLAAVLFTDIVDSTAQAARHGDAAWRGLLDRHDRLTREHIALFGGRLIERTGDGTLATFEWPGRALDCAGAIHEAVRPLGLALRAGLHFGEVEAREDGRVGGMAVHIGARVMAAAGAGEVLVSRTVHDVLLGSRYAFRDRGEHELKGVPGRWTLFSLGTQPAS